MKNNIKKMLTVCLLASLTVTAFGCSKDTNSSEADANTSQETMSLEQAKQPLTFVHDTAPEAEGTEANAENAETTASGESATPATTAVKSVEATEFVEVTDTAGNAVTDAQGKKQTEVVTVTKFVPVTEAGGQPVTDAKGEPQTEAVPVTETVVVTEAGENIATLKPEDTPQPAYTPSYDICKAYWLDMSQESDFMFEGQFLIIEFKINESTPDGSYPVTLSQTDIASWEEVSYTPTVINGEVAVNTEVQPQEDFPADDFALKVNSVSAKQGDTVTMAIDLKNNPGFCGFVIDIQYDKSAMTIVNTRGGADFVSTAVNYLTPNNN